MSEQGRNALGKRARAAWGYPHDLSETRAVGKVIGYSADPMYLLEADDGEQIWWASSLTRIEEQATPPDHACDERCDHLGEWLGGGAR